MHRKLVSKHVLQLYVSVDFCANWILVSRHVSPSLKWGIPDKNGHTDVIYAEVEDIESGNNLRLTDSDWDYYYLNQSHKMQNGLS